MLPVHASHSHAQVGKFSGTDHFACLAVQEACDVFAMNATDPGSLAQPVRQTDQSQSGSVSELKVQTLADCAICHMQIISLLFPWNMCSRAMHGVKILRQFSS